MKLHRLSNSIPVAVLAALLPLGIATSHAVPAGGGGSSLEQAHPQPMGWEEAKRHKLRHAYWLLEQADRDYAGHRGKAMEEIRKAAEMIGMDLHGEGYSGEKQHWSDARLREARGLLEDVVEKTGEREHLHIRNAIHEIDRALEVH